MSDSPWCEHFKPSPVFPWICAWWDAEETNLGRNWFCSRPDWEERDCETRGLRLMPRADQEDDGWQDAVDMREVLNSE